MFDIIFTAKKNTMAKPVKYHVNEANKTIAIYKAWQVFELENKTQYYDKILI